MTTFRNCCVIALFALTAAVAQTPAAAGKRIAATVDASKTGPTISPYLYGQFIEHIGDTINRSLWAEMIDDRKFYYAINSHPPAPPARGRRGGGPGGRGRAYPWRPIGPDESVTMDTDNAYSGKQSLLIQLAL